VHGRVGARDGIASASTLLLDPIGFPTLRRRFFGASVLWCLLLFGVGLELGPIVA
jgi:hypothetical protein